MAVPLPRAQIKAKERQSGTQSRTRSAFAEIGRTHAAGDQSSCSAIKGSGDTELGQGSRTAHRNSGPGNASVRRGCDECTRESDFGMRSAEPEVNASGGYGKHVQKTKVPSEGCQHPSETGRRSYREWMEISRLRKDMGNKDMLVLTSSSHLNSSKG